jgi:hypothetical protein
VVVGVLVVVVGVLVVVVVVVVVVAAVVVVGGGGVVTAARGAVASDVAIEDPFLFVAVTVTRNALPSSPAAGENVGLVAPAMPEHAPSAHVSH